MRFSEFHDFHDNNVDESEWRGLRMKMECESRENKKGIKDGVSLI
jgi:hypothetical protein